MKFLSLLALTLLTVPLFAADLDDDVVAQRALAVLLPGASVTLDQAFGAAEAKGVPFNGGYDFEAGKLWIAVQVLADHKATEIRVDAKTGAIIGSSPLTAWRDVRDLPTQTTALDKAKVSLHKVIVKAAAANQGFKPVSATIILWRGEPKAELVIAKGTDYRLIELPMD